MRFEGKVWREGRFWLAELPLLDALTQGRTRKGALAMISDWVETAVDRSRFRAVIHEIDRSRFELEGSDANTMIALLLLRQRQASGLSLSEISKRLDAKSRNAYARYERGESVPTVEKLDELLKAVSPHGDFVIRESSG
jgi:Helix-turn-helix